MNKSFKKFLKFYLIIGVIWGLLARFPNGLELSGYSEGRLYQNRITNVTKSFMTSSGDFILCMKGRLAYSIKYPPDITDFSISIPLNKIISQETYKDKNINFTNLKSNSLSLSHKVIGEKCNKVQGVTEIQIKLADYSPVKAYDFNSIRDLKDIKPVEDEEYMVFVVPTANSYYDGPKLAEEIRIFLIMENSDVIGRNYYKIRLKDTWIDRDVGIDEYFVAFLKDALFYPVWMVMLVSW